MRTVNITKYICEYCNSEYNTIEDAKKCEDFHSKNFTLDLTAKKVYGKTSKFPSFITLISEDNKKAIYSIYSQNA